MAKKHIYTLERMKTWSKDLSDDEIEAIAYALKTLNQEPCEDCVSRKAVKEALRNRTGESISDCINALPSVTPTQKWIPCSDRLPEEKVEVLVTTEWGSITIAERYSANDYFINDGAANANEDEITAWMPLPKPYEGDKKDD